jgi:hypothetical protein
LRERDEKIREEILERDKKNTERRGARGERREL